MTEDIHDMN